MDNEGEQHNIEGAELCGGVTNEESREDGKETEGKDREIIKEGIEFFIAMPYYFRLLIGLVIVILFFAIGYYMGLQNGFNQGVEQYAGKIFLN